MAFGIKENRAGQGVFPHPALTCFFNFTFLVFPALTETLKTGEGPDGARGRRSRSRGGSRSGARQG